MRAHRGFTLVELIIALVLVAALIVGIAAVEGSFYGIKRGVLDKQMPAIQGNLAIATIFERVLRASGGSNEGPAFTISQDSERIDYKRDNVAEAFYLSGAELKYKRGNIEKVVLRNIKPHGLKFGNIIRSRLDVDIEMENGDIFRSSVQPRNQYTPQSLIN